MDKQSGNWFGDENGKNSKIPSSWQGWIAALLYGGALMASTYWFSLPHDNPELTYNFLYTVMMIGSTAIYLLLAKFKGPKSS